MDDNATLSAVQRLQTQPIEIFRAGRVTDMSGGTHDFGAATVRDIATAYDPATSQAPVVVGHPELNAPAYGWVERLSVDERGTLRAHLRDVAPEFADAVAAGRYRQRSASFFSPSAPGNPTPGRWYLRHVGFLGAAPPAVKGLRPIQFAAEGAGVVSFAVGDKLVTYLMRKLREWLIDEFGADKADRALPGWDVAALETAVAQQDAADEAVRNEERQMDRIAELQAQLEAERAARQAAEAQLAAARSAEQVSFADALVRAGRVLPKDRGAVIAALDALATAQARGAVQFADPASADAQPQPVDALGWLRSHLQGMAPVVPLGEHRPAGGAVLDFAAPLSDGANDAELHARAKAYATAHRISYAEALSAVAPRRAA